MALLSVEKRKQYFKDLGLGDYNKANIKKFQAMYMWRKSDVDGIWGPNSDNTLRTVWNTWKYTKNFNAKEFRCECGGKYCCGYPTFMRASILKNIQAIRNHWNRPVTITCGLRCSAQNKKVGGISNSKHKSGRAVDFHQKGVTETLAQRRSSMAWIRKLPKHTYSYGHQLDSNGDYYYAPGMGNALHTDTE